MSLLSGAVPIIFMIFLNLLNFSVFPSLETASNPTYSNYSQQRTGLIFFHYCCINNFLTAVCFFKFLINLCNLPPINPLGNTVNIQINARRTSSLQGIQWPFSMSSYAWVLFRGLASFQSPTDLGTS